MYGSGSGMEPCSDPDPGTGVLGSAQVAKPFQKRAAALLKCFAKDCKHSEQFKESSRKFYFTKTRKDRGHFDTFERFHVSVSLKVPLQIAICDKWFSTCRTKKKNFLSNVTSHVRP
jgi:hypothetical protein